jgi:hypothetical protein
MDGTGLAAIDIKRELKATVFLGRAEFIIREEMGSREKRGRRCFCRI